MPRVNPFTVTVYSKALAFQQRLGSALSYSFTPRFTLGTGEVITRASDPANSLLGQPGARMVVEYRGEVLMSGFVQQRTGDVLQAGTCAWTLYDDRYLLTFVRAYVRPGANLTPTSLSDSAQQVPPAAGHTDGRADGTGYFAWPADVSTTEAAIKRIATLNLARFGTEVMQGRIAVQPDQGRGGDARAAGRLPQLRFDTLHDGLLDLLDWSGLLLRVWQPPNGLGAAGELRLDVTAPKTWSQTIGSRSGIIAGGTYQTGIPTATRVILGGPGDDAARLFWGAQDAALEATWGIAVETFSEATGSSLVWPDGLADAAKVAMYYLQRTDVAAADKTALQTYLVQAAATALAAGRPLSGLSISLAETASFHYGGPDGYHVGDRITVAIAGGPSITQRISECTLAFTVADGLKVEPKVGDIADDPTVLLAEAVAAIAQTVSRLSTRT